MLHFLNKIKFDLVLMDFHYYLIKEKQLVFFYFLNKNKIIFFKI